MARKLVTVLLADGTVHEYITHREAFSKVTSQKAEWIGEDCRTLRLIDSRITPRGFLDAWQKRPSGNYLSKEVSESLPRGCRGMRGEMVMQLV